MNQISPARKPPPGPDPVSGATITPSGWLTRVGVTGTTVAAATVDTWTGVEVLVGCAPPPPELRGSGVVVLVGRGVVVDVVAGVFVAVDVAVFVAVSVLVGVSTAPGVLVAVGTGVSVAV